MDAERSAALLDGRLTGDERERALEELAADPELLRTYADECVSLRHEDAIRTQLEARLAELDQGKGIPADEAMEWVWRKRRTGR